MNAEYAKSKLLDMMRYYTGTVLRMIMFRFSRTKMTLRLDDADSKGEERTETLIFMSSKIDLLYVLLGDVIMLKLP